MYLVKDSKRTVERKRDSLDSCSTPDQSNLSDHPSDSASKQRRPTIPPSENPFRIRKAPTMDVAHGNRAGDLKPPPARQSSDPELHRRAGREYHVHLKTEDTPYASEANPPADQYDTAKVLTEQPAPSGLSTPKHSHAPQNAHIHLLSHSHQARKPSLAHSPPKPSHSHSHSHSPSPIRTASISTARSATTDRVARIDIYARASASLQTILAEQHALQRAELDALRAQLETTTAEKEMLSLGLLVANAQCVELQKAVARLEMELVKAAKERERREKMRREVAWHAEICAGMLAGATEALGMVRGTLARGEEGCTDDGAFRDVDGKIGAEEDGEKDGDGVEDEDEGGEMWIRKGKMDDRVGEMIGGGDEDAEQRFSMPPPRYTLAVASAGGWGELA